MRWYLFLHLMAIGSHVMCIDVSKYYNIGSSSCTMAKYFAVFSGGFVPMCKPDGTFKEKQCYDGWCWCVSEQTGQEVGDTRVQQPNEPNCEYVAFAASQVDLINVVAKEKDDAIKLVPDVFMSKPAYLFPPSSSINTPMKNYLPPTLWPEFSVLVTVKPEEHKGGFLFAVMDSLESVVQFGLSLSAGNNDYTQTIDIWYTQHLQQKMNTSTQPTMGSVKLASLMVPLMVDRWSRFAIGVTEEKLNLFVYCHNYTTISVSRDKLSLEFTEDSLLLVGHAGGLIQQPFKGEIQELLLTDDPGDAAIQCDESFQRQRQWPGETEEMEYGYGSPPDDEGEDEDLVASGDTGYDYVTVPTILPLLPTISKVKHYTEMPTSNSFQTTIPADWNEADNNEKVAINGEIGGPTERSQEHGYLGKGARGEKGDVGPPGPPGKHGVNGAPGEMGEIGPRGLPGQKGEKGAGAVGAPGEKGEPGESVVGEKGASGIKGEPGETVVGPPGPPGAGLLEELRTLNSVKDEHLLNRIATISAFVGQKGEPGLCNNITGQTGEPGLDGLPGTPGEQGEKGRRGHRGEPGLRGRAGEKGEKGDKGNTGGLGVPGFTGAKGDKGSPGAQGAPGEPGRLITSEGTEILLIPGPRGRQGLDGERGFKGLPGKRGLPGTTGRPGKPGVEGRPGIVGKPGTAGLPGLDGLPGVQGPTGRPGRDGEKGTKGEPGVGLPGPPGPPGVHPSRPFFSSDWLKETGDGELAELKGEPGVKGDKGETGLPGSMSYDDMLKLVPLFATKGDKGEPGYSGSSASTTGAVEGEKGERGNDGPAGLQGDPGEKGSNGLPGFPGRPGSPGAPGESIRGPPGRDGVCLSSDCTARAGQKGERGRDGLPGLSGLRGPPGRQGKPGTGGDKGEAGPPGIVRTSEGVLVVPGPPGRQGPPGQTIVGLRGATGPPGPPGPPGLPGRGGQISPTANHGYPLSDSGVLLFSTEDDMSRASLAIPIGTMGFISDQQRLYLRVRLGWQLVQMGHVVPLMESEMANVIPMWMDAPTPDVVHHSAGKPGHAVHAVRMFALNEPMNGDLGGIAGADAHCYRHAVNSGVEGEFRAILTSRLQDISFLVFTKYRSAPVVNGKGQKILESWSSIENGKSDLVGDVPIYTFDGTNINEDSRWSTGYLWHGSRRTGGVAINEYCQAWTSSSPKELGASSSYRQGQLLDQSAHLCDSLLAVLCIETHIN